MIALYVILSIIFILVVLLLCPVFFYISFDEELYIKCRFLCFLFSIYPQKEEKKQNYQESKKEINKNNKLLGIIKEEGLNYFLKLVKKILSLAVDILKKVSDHMYVDSLNLNIVVAKEDAASTATEYGKVCSIVHPALNLILKGSYKKTYNINIQPDFTKQESKVNLKIKSHIRLIYILICALRAFVKFIKVYIKNFK